MGSHRWRAAALVVAMMAVLMGAMLPNPSPARAASTDDPDQGKLMLLLDSSGSMKEPTGGGQTKIAAAKTALDTVISKLPAQTDVGLRVFGAKVFSRTDKGACTDSQQVVAPGTDNRSDLRSAISGYKPYGETPIPYALEQAAKDLGTKGPRSIVLVSDGESTCKPDPCEVAGRLAKQGIDLHINVVGLSVSGAARNQLKCIADSGHGTYYDANSAADIQSQLVRVAQRAARPFTVAGSAVSGGSSQASATSVSAGDHSDVIPATGSLYYTYDRKTAGSTLRISAYLQEISSLSYLSADLYAPDGTRCAAQVLGRSYDSRNVLGVQVTASPTGSCAKAGNYLVKVSRILHGGTPDALPLGLRVTDEPPIKDPGYTGASNVDVTAPTVSGAAKSLDSGSSFEGAPELTSGTYTSNAVAGEANLFRFHLGYGQSARISVDFDAATQAQQKIIGRISGPVADLSLFSPMRARAGQPTAAVFSGAAGVVPSGGAKALDLSTATPTVSATASSSDLTSGFPAGGDYQTAGDYFLVVSLEKQDYSIEFPYTVKLQVVGEEKPGPTFANGAKWNVTDGTTSSGTDQAGSSGGSSSSPSASTSNGSGGHGLLAGGLGLAGLAVLVAAGLLIRRARSSS